MASAGGVKSVGFFTQTGLLIVKNLKCKIRGDKYRLLGEILFPFLYLLILVALALTQPDTNYKEQSEEDTKETNILEGIRAGAFRSPRVIGIYPNDSSVLGVGSNIRSIWRNRGGSSTELTVRYYHTYQSLEDAHNDGKDGIDIGLHYKYHQKHPFYTLLTDSGGFFSPPDVSLRTTDRAACRQNSIKKRGYPERPDTCPVNGYFYSGTLGFQYLFNQALIEFYLPGTRGRLPDIEIQNYPKRAYIAEMPKFMRALIPLFSVIPMAQLVNGLLVMIVTEKESRIKDGLRMIGVSDSAYWFSWFAVYSILLGFISAIFAVGLAFCGILQNANILILFLLFFSFGLSTITFAFALTPFFHSPKTAGAVGTLVLQFCGMLFLVQTFVTKNPSTEILLLSLRVISSLAFTTGLDEICEHDHINGVGFKDIIPGARADRVLYSFIFIIFDTIFYAFIAIYLDNVLPNEYGARKHPMFCFMSSCCNRKQAVYEKATADEQEDPNVEPAPTSLIGKEAIRIKDVSKTYTTLFSSKKTDAIKNISLDIYENQITAILGKNGAGKSTLFSVIIGLIPPTNGKSVVFGLDTSNPNDLDKLRKMTGVCLQNDIHFGPLTTKEHLLFYGRMRGLKGPALENEVNSILRDLKLTDKQSSAASTLSGGQKRKLSVGAALIGDPKIILLDEPSAGVDPVSRRQLWSLLRSKKEGRVILLATHFLDEADFLADRKAIINNGELKCVGSSLFLKNRFGVGYHVSIETEETYDEDVLDRIFKKYVPSSLETKRFVGGKEVKYSLPYSEVQLFPDLFRDLETLIAKNSKDYISYGVSMTTLEEVFLMICNEELDIAAGAFGAHEKGRKVQFGEDVNAPEEEEFDNKRKRRSSATGDEFNLINDKMEIEIDFINSWSAQVLIRYRRIARNLPSLFFMILLPSIMVAVALALMQRQNITHQVEALSLNDPTKIYPSHQLKIAVEPEIFDHGFPMFLKSKGFVPVNYSGKYSELLSSEFPEGTMASIRMGSNFSEPFRIRINGTILHGPPLILNALTEYYLKLIGRNFTADMKPFVSRRTILDYAAFYAVMLIGPTFIFPAAGMVMELIKDREINVRDHLRVNGVSFSLYFLPIFTIYSVLSFFVLLLQLFVVYLFALPPFANIYAFFVMIMLLMLFIPSCLLFSAAFSYLFNKVETAQTIFVPLAWWLCTLVGILVIVLDAYLGSIWSTSHSSTILIIHGLFSLVDVFYIPFGIFYWVNKQHSICVLRGTCDDIGMRNYLGTEFITMACALLIQIPIFCLLLFVADSAKTHGMVTAAFANLFKKPKRVSPANNNNTKPTVTGAGVTVKMDPVPEESVGTAEEDVINEGSRVKQLWDNEVADDIPVVLVKDVKKTYSGKGSAKPVRALNGLSFVVEEGDVFGLLGHNGAGKSTAIRIIIAAEAPTEGKVKVCNEVIESVDSKAFAKMGYCSQEDPLWDNITFKEHLQTYAIIRGVPEEKQESLINRLITGLQVEDHADIRVGKLSGGTKRKLSYAISVLGVPKIVLLDEPSTGLDPQSKRFLWNTVLGSFKFNRGAILTTHSIEEAEILCSKIGILSKGDLICIGSPQHLKTKYGAGYTLEIKLKSNPLNVDTGEEKFSFVKTNFPESAIAEIFDEKAVFSLPSASVQSISKTFALLEKLKVDFDIEEYSFSQTTLEQIFLSFTHGDEEEVVGTTGTTTAMAKTLMKESHASVKRKRKKNPEHAKKPENQEEDPSKTQQNE